MYNILDQCILYAITYMVYANKSKEIIKYEKITKVKEKIYIENGK